MEDVFDIIGAILNFTLKNNNIAIEIICIVSLSLCHNLTIHQSFHYHG